MSLGKRRTLQNLLDKVRNIDLTASMIEQGETTKKQLHEMGIAIRTIITLTGDVLRGIYFYKLGINIQTEQDIGHGGHKKYTLKTGGFFSTKLSFIDIYNSSGSKTRTMIKKYKPGNWQLAVKFAERMIDEANEKTLTSQQVEIERRTKEEQQLKRRYDISYYEQRIRKNPQDEFSWKELAPLYGQEGKYKDMESALMKCIELREKSEMPSIWDYKHLGELYLSVLSNSVRGKWLQISISTLVRGEHRFPGLRADTPLKPTIDSLDYTFEKVQILAKDNIEEACKLAKGNYTYKQELRELKLALKVATEPSEEAFEEYDNFLAEQKAKAEDEWWRRWGKAVGGNKARHELQAEPKQSKPFKVKPEDDKSA